MILSKIAAWFRTPHGGVAAPHGGETTPPGGETVCSPQEIALAKIVGVWTEQAATAFRRQPEAIPARVLACRFRSCLQSEPALIGWWVRCAWVQKYHPLFCRALNAEPVAYKTFARELADGVMPRERIDDWKDGRRLGTYRHYLVPDPADAVISLEAPRRA